MRILQERDHSSTAQRYIELDDVGHCPNHESPQAVAKILRRWLSASDRRHQSLLLLRDNEEDSVTVEPWGIVKMREVEDNDVHPSSLFDRMIIRMIG